MEDIGGLVILRFNEMRREAGYEKKGRMRPATCWGHEERTDRQTDRQTGTHTHTPRQPGRQADRETDRHTDSQVGRSDRQERVHTFYGFVLVLCLYCLYCSPQELNYAQMVWDDVGEEPTKI